MENRHFTRIDFSTEAVISQGNQSWETHIFDLSFKGALIRHPQNFEVNERKYQLRFKLSESHIEITMTVLLSHTSDGLIGLKCEYLDIDSMTHLRRLMELNMNSDELLHRDIQELTKN